MTQICPIWNTFGIPRLRDVTQLLLFLIDIRLGQGGQISGVLSAIRKLSTNGVRGDQARSPQCGPGRCGFLLADDLRVRRHLFGFTHSSANTQYLSTGRAGNRVPTRDPESRAWPEERSTVK